MWPWEHAVVGYVAYSVVVHVFRRRSPTDEEAVVVVFASVLPDLIDKPLAWEYGMFGSGYGLAHSVFFAVPLAFVAVGVAALLKRPEIGAAFATGYLLHLPADVVPRYVVDGRLPIGRLLWPLSRAEASYPEGFFGTFRAYLGASFAELLSGPPSGYVLGVGAMMVACVLLWVYDGMPGLRKPATVIRRRLRLLSSRT